MFPVHHSRLFEHIFSFLVGGFSFGPLRLPTNGRAATVNSMGPSGGSAFNSLSVPSERSLSYFWSLRLARFRASQQKLTGSIFGQRHGDGHVVDHTAHTIDVGDEFGDQGLFGGVFGNAA
jgi:hypothetical protein